MGGYFILLFSVAHYVHAASGEYKSYENYKLFTVESGQHYVQSVLETMKDFEKNILLEGNRTTSQVLVAPELTSHFESLIASNNMTSKLIIDDMSQIIRMEKMKPPGAEEFSWTAYYDVDDMYKYLKNMSQKFPKSTELVVGGKSYQGRQLLGLRINTPGNRLDGKDKPAMFIESGIHACEWITPAAVTYFLNELLHNPDPEIQKLRDKFDWHIFPTVNPDGYHHTFVAQRYTRKTLSPTPNPDCLGTDGNRNWDYHWSKPGASSDPCAGDYYGSKPFSEIEYQTLSTYISNLKNLQGYFAFHSYGQLLAVPYSDSKKHVENYDDLVRIGKVAIDYAYKVNGVRYRGPGTSEEKMYKMSGASIDWVRSKLKTPLVYLIELRGERFHWPPSRIHEQGDEVTQMMLGIAHAASDMGYF